MFIIYDIIFFIYLIIYFPIALVKGKVHKGFWSQMGFHANNELDRFSQTRNVWIHAVSVGEVLAIVPLIEKIKHHYPEVRIICTTVTKTGQELAAKRLKDHATVIYAPFDLSLIVRYFVKKIHPLLYISAETEIWPNLYRALHKRDVPIIQVNGRISDKSFRGYQMMKFLSKKVLGYVNCFCVQTELDEYRLEYLKADSASIHVVGNMKFDTFTKAESINLGLYGFSSDDLVLIAGSTHPGEEEIVLNAYKRLTHVFSGLRLIIAPRHIERVREVERLIQEKGFEPVKFTRGPREKTSQEQVLIIDTIGQLASMYSLATVVFVGKTLCGWGGQNVIEPALFSKPVIVGPNMQNFSNVSHLLLNNAALIQVRDEKEFEVELERLLASPSMRKMIGGNAFNVIQENRGATDRTMQILKSYLERGK